MLAGQDHTLFLPDPEADLVQLTEKLKLLTLGGKTVVAAPWPDTDPKTFGVLKGGIRLAGLLNEIFS